MNATLQILEMLSAAYPRQVITEATIDAYMVTLQDVPPELLKAAALKHVTESKWFPTVAELRGAASALIAQVDGVPLPHAAWMEVKRLRREFSHPFIKKAIDRLGGMEAYGRSDVSEEMSWRAQFLSAYTQICEQAHEERIILPAVKEYRERLTAMTDEYKSLADAMKIPAVLGEREQEAAANKRRNKLYAQVTQ
ncbi:MAG: replicative helicase loader/inhibitor [Anaerolineae bacterium]|nr:replicative helicase loader/inhibitor [Anaerolineae bacterium]